MADTASLDVSRFTMFINCTMPEAQTSVVIASRLVSSLIHQCRYRI